MLKFLPGKLWHWRLFLLLLTFMVLVTSESSAQLPPANVQLKTTATGNLLQWLDGGSNGATTLVRYEIGRSITRGAGYAVIGNTTSLNYTDTTAAAGTTYYYVVRDVYAGPAGTTAWSEELIRFYPFDASTAEAQFYKNEKVVRARWPIYENEIVKTFVGLSTVPGEANVVNFIDVGHATEYIFNNLNLQVGPTYYVTVKVQGTAGFLNDYGTSICSSNGFTLNIDRDLVDDTGNNFFNNAQARVMTKISAGGGEVEIRNFNNNLLRRYRRPIFLTEPGIESRFNAPVEVSLSGAGFPANLTDAQRQIRIADEWGNEVQSMVTTNQAESLIYETGIEYTPFVPGFSAGTGAQSKTTTFMQVTATNNGGQRTWVTDVPVDMTGWDEVSISWSNTGGNSANQQSHFIISSSKMGNNTVWDRILTRSNTFAQVTQTLDVSALNGLYYIRVHAQRVSNQNSIVNIFRIAMRRTGDSQFSNVIFLANLPRGGSKTYWSYWGGGSAIDTAFPSNSNDTSQRAWSRFYSRKLLPPGVEDFPVSAYTKLTAPGNTDDGNVAVTMPWGFPFFGKSANTLYFATNSCITFVAFNTYTNLWATFTGTAHGGMIAPIWCDTMAYRVAPQDSGLYTLRANSGDANDRMIFYSRDNRYNKQDDIYIHQAVLYGSGDIAINYEYLSPGALYGDTVTTDRPVNVAPNNTCGLSNADGTNYFTTTPLREGIGKTPSSFFQYRNAVNYSLGTTEDAGNARGFAGHFDSHIFDSRTSTPNYLSMDYEVAANGGRFIFYLRSGSTPEPGTGWTNWTQVATDVAGNGSVAVPAANNHRFIQYRCVFIKSGDANTPTLNKVTFICRGIEITKVVANTPDGVSQGQDGIPVTVSVKNFHTANVSLNSLQLTFTLGTYTQILSSPTLPDTIGANLERDFNFLVNVDNNSPIGSATIDAMATGTAGALTFSDVDADIPDTWLVRKKAELSISQIDATPPTVNKGQTVLVRMLIDNIGGTPLIFDAATLTFSLGIYNPVTLNTPAPGYILADGASMIATFSVKIDTNSPSGVAILNGTATGRNWLSNKITSDTAALITDSWIIQNPAKFVIQSVIASDTVYRGQTNIPVFINVSNIGEALAIWETSMLLPFFTLGTYGPEDPKSTFPIDIFGGLNAVAEYWISVAENSATGTSVVDAGVDGTDGNTLDFIFANNAIYPSSWTIIGEKVKNYKDSAMLFESTSYNRPTAGTVDIFAKASDLAPLKEFTVRWYRPDGTQFAVTAPPLTSDASGTVSHQIAITSAVPFGLWSVKLTNPLNTFVSCQNFFEVVSPASIAIKIDLPARVSIGQTFIASTTITNAGGAVLKTAEPGNLLKIGPGNANIVSGPTPAIQDVAGNSAATYTYQWNATTAGNFSIRGNSTGYDGNSDAFLTSATATSNLCLVQTAPVLSVDSITEAYTSVNRNQQNLTVTMTIRNTGQADAIVEAASLTFSLGSHTQSINLPTAYPFTLGGGQTRNLIFTVGVNADSPVGAVDIGGSFRAYDSNDPSSFFYITGGAGDWTIAEVVCICSANSSYNPEQYAFNLGQTVFARFTNLPLNTAMRIRFYNVETAGTAVKVSPALNSGAFGVCDDLWTLVTGSPARRWRVIIQNEAGTTTYGTQYFDVQNPGNLLGALTLSPTSLFVGETFTATLVASNTVATGSTIAPVSATDLTRTTPSTGNATRLTGPLPATATVQAGTAGTYKWTYETTADTTMVGSFSLIATLTYSAQGFDVNTGAEVLSNRAVSNGIFIYRRGIDIASITLDHGILAPGQSGPVLNFRVINNGNYNLNSVKWATADLRNEYSDYISKAYLDFTPSPLGFIAANTNTVAQAQLSIPFNQASGSYIATMSVYEDLDGNDNRDFFEPAKLFSVQVIVPSRKLIIISNPLIDLENWGQGQTTNVIKLNYFNGGNLDLERLKIKAVPSATATFLTINPINPGALNISNASFSNVFSAIPATAATGLYVATYSLYDDENNDGFVGLTEPVATFVVKIGVGIKQFNITPALVNSGPATPTYSVEGLPFQINNTGFLNLTRLKPTIGTLIDGANSIASDNVAIFLPAIASAGQSTPATLNLYIPAGTPIGSYTGVINVFEDNNNNGLLDAGEASASFSLMADVRQYRAVQVIPSTVDFGDLSAGTGFTTSVLCRNIGNVPLSNLLWEKVNLTSGANSIASIAYSFLPSELPFSVPPGQLFTRSVSISIPPAQADGNYLGNSTWIFDDLPVMNSTRNTGEPQDNFLVSCRVGNHFIDIVEAGQTSSGNPYATSTSAIFNIKNNGTLTISNPKARASILTGPGTDIPATSSIFLPTIVGYILQNQTKPITWRVFVPANQPPGLYTGTVTVWNDSNNDGIIDAGEASDNATLSLTVLSKKVVEVMQKPLEMGAKTQGNTFTNTIEIWNRGNIDLQFLKGLPATAVTSGGDTIPAASITFAIPAGGALPVGNAAVATVTVVVGIPQSNGLYLANLRVYDDYAPNNGVYTVNEESDPFVMRLTIGQKSVSATNLTFPATNPGTTATSNMGTVANTSEVQLNKLRWSKGSLVHTAYPTITIPVASLTFTPTAATLSPINGLSSKFFTLQAVIGPYQLHGTYIGTHTVWEDDDGNNLIHPTNEATGTFITTLVVNPVDSLTILTDPVDLGKVQAGRGSADNKASMFIRNTGNTVLNFMANPFGFALFPHVSEPASIPTSLFQWEVPAFLDPGENAEVKLYLDPLSATQTTGIYNTTATLTGVSAFGSPDDSTSITCEVLPGGPSFASGTVYQEIATATFPAPASRFILSAWVAPGLGSATVGFSIVDGESNVVETISIDVPSGTANSTNAAINLVASGIINQVPAQHAIFSNWYRVYIAFDYFHNDSIASKTYIMLNNRNEDNLNPLEVLFDGVQLERAIKPGQTKPTSYHQGAKIVSPNETLDLQGQRQYFEW